jgi:hypothetical protein
MAWEPMWADLAAQADAWDRADLEAEVAERVLIERSSVSWADRLRASLGQPVAVRTRGGRQWRGVVHACGRDFIALAAPATAFPAYVIVAGDAVVEIAGLPRAATPQSAMGPSAARRSLSAVLRRIAGEGVPVVVHLDDGSVCPGNLSAVGGDYVDLVDDRSGTRTVPVAAMVAVTQR